MVMKITHLKKGFTIFLSVVSVILVFQAYKLILPEPRRRIEPIRTVYTFNRTGTKFVLFYNSRFSSKTYYFKKIGYHPFRNCKVKNCYVTANKHLLPIEEFDALLFHIPLPHYLNHRDVLPQKRSPHQRYIFANFETPINYVGKRTQYVLDGFFNWTMTYRLDSDIPWTLGSIVKGKTKYTMPTEEFVRNKTRTAAWFVSNCNALNRRAILGEELGRYIDVDVYGTCGTLTCKKSDDCYGMLERKYGFYLAFENSNCRDYVTEKFFNVLGRNVIPVVYGAPNYTHLAPPHSHINVDDFENVEILANYLNQLQNDVKRYLEYFEWKKNYYVDNSSDRYMCRLCAKLNNPDEPSKTYYDIHDWWWGERNARCQEKDTSNRVSWLDSLFKLFNLT